MKFYIDLDTKEIVNTRENDKDYRELIANEIDASLEKHVPVYEVINDKIKVRVGSIDHPMEENHYIQWIAMEKDGDLIKKELNPNDKPEAMFDYIPGTFIYAYCNLHGLWKNNVE